MSTRTWIDVESVTDLIGKTVRVVAGDQVIAQGRATDPHPTPAPQHLRPGWQVIGFIPDPCADGMSDTDRDSARRSLAVLAERVAAGLPGIAQFAWGPTGRMQYRADA